MPTRFVKSLIALLVLAFAGFDSQAQTGTVTATHILAGNGAPLASGQFCFGNACLPVLNGILSGSTVVPQGTGNLSITDGFSGITNYLNITIGATFNYDGFVLAAGQKAFGPREPFIPCSNGAQYLQTYPNTSWTCNASGAWGLTPAAPALMNPSSIAQTIVAQAGCGLPGANWSPQSNTCTAPVVSANPTSYVAFGDSNTQSPDGYLANGLNVYVNRLANVLAIASPVNYGTGGDQACDVGNRWMFPNYAPGTTLPYSLVTLMIGTNDQNFNPGPSAYQSTALTCYGADLTWATIPSSAKVMAGSGTTTGTCTADTTYGQAPGEKCTAIGSTLSLPFSTTQLGAVYLWARFIDGDAGTWTYSLDGAPAVTRTTALSPAIATHNGSTAAPGMIRLANVSPGNHTLLFTQTGAGTMSILGIGHPPSTTSTSTTPYMVVGTLINQANGLNQTGVNAYRADQKSEIAQLKTDGLLLFLAPTDTYVSMTTAAGDIAPTGGTLHMYDNGQGEAALAFLSALSMYPGNASSSGSLLTTANTWSQAQTGAAGAASLPSWGVGGGNGIFNAGGSLGLAVSFGTAARLNNSDWRWNGNAPFTFSSGDPTATFGDVGMSRISPAVMSFGNGAWKDTSAILEYAGEVGPATAPTGTCGTPGETVHAQSGSTKVCLGGVWSNPLGYMLAATLTTTANATDVVPLPGMTSTGHCAMPAPTNTAAVNDVFEAQTIPYVSVKATNSVTVTHDSVAGYTYDVLCSPY